MSVQCQGSRPGWIEFAEADIPLVDDYTGFRLERLSEDVTESEFDAPSVFQGFENRAPMAGGSWTGSTCSVCRWFSRGLAS